MEIQSIKWRLKKGGLEYLWVQLTAGGPGLRGMQARSIVSGDVAGW